ncbi:MAG: C-GCAxxG-C-C family protein [Firmicutes bacterium]|jgi:C_GCAxxG_C_C family probable redox protein|nr:C-GCAxxG-C-C family protein [Bacillota bacterium]
MASNEAAESAARHHDSGFNCAESVLAGLAEAVGIPGAVVSAATGFGGGIGRRGDTCGALTGAVIAVGLKCGRTSPGEKELYERIQRIAARLQEEFAGAHGSVYCRDLIPYDLRDPAQLAEYRRDAATRNKCRDFVMTAARTAARLLEAGPGA